MSQKHDFPVRHLTVVSGTHSHTHMSVLLLFCVCFAVCTSILRRCFGRPVVGNKRKLWKACRRHSPVNSEVVVKKYKKEVWALMYLFTAPAQKYQKQRAHVLNMHQTVQNDINPVLVRGLIFSATHLLERSHFSHWGKNTCGDDCQMVYCEVLLLQSACGKVYRLLSCKALSMSVRASWQNHARW